MGNPKVVIQRSEGQFHFNLVAGNGEIILMSERVCSASHASPVASRPPSKCSSIGRMDVLHTR